MGPESDWPARLAQVGPHNIPIEQHCYVSCKLTFKLYQQAFSCVLEGNFTIYSKSTETSALRTHNKYVSHQKHEACEIMSSSCKQYYLSGLFITLKCDILLLYCDVLPSNASVISGFWIIDLDLLGKSSGGITIN
jgi:hypothetical protein